MLDGKALPVIEIEPLEGFYDYKNKYKAGSTKETCPANIPEDIASQMQFWAEKCCQAAGVTTYARVDELLDKNNYFIISSTKHNYLGESTINPKRMVCPYINEDEKQWDFYNKWLSATLAKKLLVIEIG